MADFEMGGSSVHLVKHNKLCKAHFLGGVGACSPPPKCFDFRSEIVSGAGWFGVK